MKETSGAFKTLWGTSDGIAGDGGAKGLRLFLPFYFFTFKTPFYLFCRFSQRYYYKPVTFLPFKLKSIKFCTGTFAIPDIFPNFAPTFLKDEMIGKIQR